MKVWIVRRSQVAVGGAVALGVAVVVLVATLTSGSGAHRTGTPRSAGPPPAAAATTTSPAGPPSTTPSSTGTVTSPPSVTPSPTAPGGPVGSPAPPARGAPGVATGLHTAEDCEYFPDSTSTPGEALLWTPGVPIGESQHVELASDPQGSGNAHFASSPPLAAKDLGFSWRGIKPGQSYLWRVVTASGNATSSSGTQSFVAQPCTGGYSGP